MSIEHCDNFSIYGGNVNLLLNGVYAAIASYSALVADPDGISPGYVFTPDQIANPGFRYVLAANQPIVGIAQRVWLPSIPGQANVFPIIASFQDPSNATIMNVMLNTVGGITVTEGSNTYSTSGPVITANGWWHIESKIDITAGSFEIRVEGATVLTETGITFSATSCAQVSNGAQVYGPDYPPQTYYKDYVVWNGAGTQNTDFLGAVLVASLVPTADVSLNWAPTPNTDTGAQILATAPPQDGVVYLDAPNPPPAPYVGTFEHLTGDISSVKCLMTFVRASKVDGGDGSLQIGLISSPASAPETVLGANRPITTAPTYWRDVFELDPKTAAEWLPSSVNLAELQINRTT